MEAQRGGGTDDLVGREGQPSATGGERPPGGPEGGGRPRRRRRWGRGFLLMLFGAGLLLGGLGVALVTSHRGQRAVLDLLLDRVRGGLAGSLTIEDIRSPSLLDGAVLVGVHLEAEGGRPFLDADSVRLRYALLGLVGSRPRVRSLTLYGPHVRITRYAGEETTNVQRLLVPSAPDSAAAGAPAGLVSLGRVFVEGGLLEVLTPAEGRISPRLPTVPAPEGEGRLRRIALEGLDLSLRDVHLRPAAEDRVEAEIEALSTDLSVLDRPLRLVGVEGRLRFGDAGLRIDSAAFRLPGSQLEGDLALGAPEGEAWGLRLEVRTEGSASLTDLSWLDARIPEGVWRGGASVTVADGVRVGLRDTRVELEAGRFSADGGVEVGREVVLDGLEVRASPLRVARLEPWLGRRLPFDGWLSGRASLSGPLSALAAEGRVSLVSSGHAGGPTTADFGGTLHLGRDPGVTSLHATLDPVNYVTLGAFLPDLHLAGTGRIVLDAGGRVDDGLRFVADVGHRLDSATVSRLLARGSVRRSAEGRWVTDVQGDLAPLALALLGGTAPSLGLRGEASGPIRVSGPTDALRVTGELEVGGGTALVEGGIDALAPAEGYRLDVRLDGVVASRVVGALPEPTEWTGHLRVDGAGLTPEALDARIGLVASGSRVGGLHVDTMTARLQATAGLLTVDTLEAELGGVRVRGSGDLGMVGDAEGRATLELRSDDLSGLRPIFRGDVVVARDSLQSLDLELLRFQGVDVDTLPTQAEVAMSGALQGEVVLSGSLERLDVRGSALVRDLVYGVERLESGEVTVDLRRVGSEEREGRVAASLRNLDMEGRDFQEVVADLDVAGRAAEGTLSITRRGAERYDLEGSFALDTLGGGEVHLGRATFAVDSLAWYLARPATVAWDRAGVTFEDFAMTREGHDPMSLAARGRLAWEGSSDLAIDLQGLHLDRVAHIAQVRGPRMAGHLDLALTMTGPASGPLIDGWFEVHEPRYGDLVLDAVSGEIAYGDRSAEIRLEASDEARRVFLAEGTVPVDLAPDARGRRLVDRPMDVTVEADSLDAAVALSWLDVLQDVHGVVSGDFRIGGTLERPEPSGVLALEGGSWAVETLGVRHTDVEGSLTLNADRTVDVSLASRQAEGESRVDGRVTLEPLNDPGLDLTIGLRNFVAVNRRDVVGHVSGEVHLGRTYRRPLLGGQLSVDHGTLFLEEFARSAEVVDLSDPRFGLMVDTAALSGRPLLEGLNNPFMQNLRVDVNLSVPRDLWLRSEDMNVEMGGDLIVSYDRSERDIVLVGELQALRGSYSVLGRRFQVEGGTVGFIGTPGINPLLDIEAVARIRRIETQPLDVTATVSGTLTQPRVTLSTEEQGIAESDLVSYLVFGRPSYQLTGDPLAGGGVAGAAAGATASFVSGTLATRLGAALSEQIGLDYLSISQVGQYGIATGVLGGSFAGTQVEVGQYIGENVFVVLIFRAPDQSGSQDVFGGARVEVQMTDDYNVQGFWEDRFLRSRAGGFGELYEDEKIVGVFIFREWGY